MARRCSPTGGMPDAQRMCGCGAWTTTRATAPTTMCTPSWPGGCVLLANQKGSDTSSAGVSLGILRRKARNKCWGLGSHHARPLG